MEDKDSNKLEHLRWILDKQIGWIVAAETKATTFIAFNFAIFTALGTLFELKTITKTDFNIHNYGLIMAIVTVVFGIIALYFLLHVFSPRLKGFSSTTHSFVFFNLIAARTEDYYKKEAPKQDYDSLAEDTSIQIFANAKIAQVKHVLIKNGIRFTYLTLISALVAISLKILC